MNFTRYFMKNTIFTLITILFLSPMAVAEHEVDDHSGEIRFTGEILGSRGCTVMTGDYNAINLGSVYKDELKRNTHSEWGEGSIELSDCSLDDIEAVELTILDGDPSDEDDEIWENKGSAEGVGIEVQITGQNGAEKVTPQGTDEPIEAEIDEYNGTASYQIQGRMVKLSDDIEEGSVEATLRFEISYR